MKTARHAHLRLWARKRHDERIRRETQSRARGAAAVRMLSKREVFSLGLGLYWGEGYKNTSNELGFTNSDPAMIRFFMRWLRSVYGISQDRLVLRVSINKVHARRVAEVEKYWSRVTRVPLRQFTKTSLISATSKKEYANGRKHYGTLRVKVRRGTDLWREILGSIEEVKRAERLIAARR